MNGTSLEERLLSQFHDGTLADAVAALGADLAGDPVVESVLLEAAAKLRWAATEMARRDRNEVRNCLNWGPCSRHDHLMCDDPTVRPGPASVGRNAERQDPEEGLGPQDEHAVPVRADAKPSPSQSESSHDSI